ncbi:MAG: hypothetical protein RQ751_06670 [Longimicrobiales bacterium]|nr:hypothetical protein [Longimicrobiales bacterium]
MDPEPTVQELPVSHAATRDGRGAEARAVARLVAVALSDPEARAALQRDLAASPHREKKLHLSSYLNSPRANRLLSRARMSNGGNEGVLTRLPLLPDLEIYMPVRSHRRRWDGGVDLLVAVQLEEEEAPVGFRLDGSQVELDLDAPPETPTIVLVPNETRDLEQLTAYALTSGSEAALLDGECDPTTQILECDEPGSTFPNNDPQFEKPAPGSLPEGFYFGQMRIWDKHEPWTRGEPELEIHVTGTQYGAWVSGFIPHPPSSPGPFFGNIFFNPDVVKPDVWTACAGRRTGDPIREFDFNDENGATYVQFVQIARSADFLQEEFLEIPNGPTVLTRLFRTQPPFRIRILERDDGRECPTEPRKRDTSFDVISLINPFSFSNIPSGVEFINAILGGDNDPVATWQFSSFVDFEIEAIRYLDGDDAIFNHNDADIWIFSNGLRYSQIPPEQNFIF